MAIANDSTGGSRLARRATGRRTWRWVILALLAALVAAAFVWRAPAMGYSGVGTAYMARVGCSCRFVAGRSLEDCAKDKMARMELVMLSEDTEARSVTARFPLLARETATLRDGYGCVLEPWDG